MPSNGFLCRFHAALDREPTAAAVRWHDAQLSYAELHDLAEQARKEIAELPPGPVAVSAPKSPNGLAMLLGCWSAGRATLVPPPDLSAELLRELALRTGCRQLLRIGPDLSITADSVDTPPQFQNRSLPEGTLLVLSTSGSTGIPKLVPMSAAGVDAFLNWSATRFQMAPGTTVLSYAPLNFDLSLLDVWAPLSAGASTALVDPAHAMDGRALARFIRATRASVIQAVPMMFRLLTAAEEAQEPFGDVREIVLTGDVAPDTLVRRILQAFPNASLSNVYGCTETNDSFLYALDRDQATDGAPLPIGHPLPGVLTRIVDKDGTVLLGPASGELLVSTPFQTSGYLDERLNAERFVPDPAGESTASFLRSGDLVDRDADGLVRLAGRADLHVKIRGVRTNIAEVEHVLAQHPEVAEAAVVALPDDQVGHLLHAVVRRGPSAALTTLALRQHCMRHLPRTAIPSTIRLVDDPLPTTSTGKVNRKLIEKHIGEKTA